MSKRVVWLQVTLTSEDRLKPGQADELMEALEEEIDGLTLYVGDDAAFEVECTGIGETVQALQESVKARRG